MSQSPKLTPLKFCEACGQKMERKRFNGRLEDLSVFGRRKFCDQRCMAVGMEGKIKVFSLRTFRQETLRAPFGREPSQQFPVQPGNLMRLMSSSLAFAKLRSDDWTAKALQTLLEVCGAEGLVSRAPLTTAATWRSSADADKGGILMGLGDFRRASVSPILYQGKVDNRAQRLRGYVNLIVRLLVTGFVFSVIEDKDSDEHCEFLEDVLLWTGPRSDEAAPSRRLFGRVPGEHRLHGPPIAHQPACNLFPLRDSPEDCSATVRRA